MESLSQYGNCGDMNTTDTTKMGYYVIKFVSEAYNLKNDTTCNGKISSSGELVVKAQYLSYMQEKKKCYWEHKQQQKVIIVSTQTILYQYIDVVTVKYVQDIPRSACNRKQEKMALQRHYIRLNDSGYDYILE